MLHRILMIIFVLGTILWVAPSARGQEAQPAADPPNAPAATTMPGNEKKLMGKVLQVKNNVQMRESADGVWQRAKKDMSVTGGTEFRTAPLSFVKIFFPNQLILLDRVGVLKVIDALRDPEKARVKTNLGLKYGRMRIDVQAAGVDYESTIYSPNATLAVRGTDAVLQDNDGFATSMSSVEGRIFADLEDYKEIAMGSRSTITTDRPTPSLKAKSDTLIDPQTKFAARSDDAEQKLVEDLPGIGGFDPVIQGKLAKLDWVRRIGRGPIKLRPLPTKPPVQG